MPFVNVNANTWTVVVTTTENALVQNRGTSPIYITTESTVARPLDEALEVPVGAAVDIATGNTVSAASIGHVGRVFYMEV